MKFNKAIIVTGKICSGKTTILRALSQDLDWPIVSFGSYVRYIAKERNLHSKREVYQSLGSELYKTLGPNKFLTEVIKFHTKFDQDNILFDGVRHISILTEIQKAFRLVYTIYLDADVELRFRRFIAKQDPSEKKLSFEEFLKIDNHPVENEIELLKKQSNIIVDSSQQVNQVFAEILEYITEQTQLNFRKN